MALGEIFAARGNYDEALESFEKALAARPKDMAARAQIVRLLNHLHRYQECLEMLGPIMAEDPQHLAWQRELALAQMGLGQLAEAKKIAQHLVKSGASENQIGQS